MDLIMTKVRPKPAASSNSWTSDEEVIPQQIFVLHISSAYGIPPKCQRCSRLPQFHLPFLLYASGRPHQALTYGYAHTHSELPEAGQSYFCCSNCRVIGEPAARTQHQVEKRSNRSIIVHALLAASPLHARLPSIAVLCQRRQFPTRPRSST